MGRYIATLKEGTSPFGPENKIIEGMFIVEDLEEVMKRFIETGYLEYTVQGRVTKSGKREKVKEKIYPEVEKLILFEDKLKVRKLPKGDPRGKGVLKKYDNTIR